MLALLCTSSRAVDKFVNLLQAFLTANLNALSDTPMSNNGADLPLGWRDAAHAYLPPQTWATIFSGVDGTRAARALLDMEMLVPGEKGRLMRKAPRAIAGR